MTPDRPPWAARALLRLLLRGDDYEVVAGDLEEDFTSRVNGLRSRGAHPWYWRQAIGAVTRITAMRIGSRIGFGRGGRGSGIGSKPGGGGVSSGFGGIRHDLKSVSRRLTSLPGSTIAAVLTLALGIGANTAVFSVLNEAVLTPWPYPDGDRIVQVWDQKSLSKSSFERVRDGVASLDFVSGVANERRSLTGEGDPIVLDGGVVSPGHFRVMGVSPAMGRVFNGARGGSSETGVVILSHGLWDRRFGRDHDVLGRSVTLDGEPVTVVGVMPENYRPYGAGWDFWTPMTIDPTDFGDYQGNAGTEIIGRLADDATPELAQAELAVVAATMAEENSGLFTENVVSRATVVPIQAAETADLGTTLWLLLGAAAFVLLVACANVANLLLVRGSRRVQEVSLRMALGAGRLGIVRLCMLEGVALSLLGGGVGLAVGAWAVRFLTAIDGGWQTAQPVGLDGRVLGFAVGASLLSAMLAGGVPAAHATRVDLRAAMSEGSTARRPGRGRLPLDSFLMGGQVAIALSLVVGTGLMLKSAWVLNSVEPGLDPSGVLTLRVNPVLAGDVEARAFYGALEERLAAVAEVQEVGLVTSLPMSGSQPATLYWPPDAPPVPDGPRSYTDFQGVNRGYFGAMGIPLLAGRSFAGSDRDGSPPVAVVNRSLAVAAFGEQDPIGEDLVLFGAVTVTVVGVVGDVRLRGLGRAARPGVYFLTDQFPATTLYLTVRTLGEAMDALPVIRETIWSLEPEAPITDEAPMSDVVQATTASTRALAVLFALFGGVALVIGMVGVYGVVSASVAKQTREIGIRMALGAARADVVRRTVLAAGPPVAIGLAVGLAATLAGTSMLERWLFQVEARDPAVLVAVTAVVSIAALLALVLPARRAATVDPARSVVGRE